MLEMGLLWYEPGNGVPYADRIDSAAERYLERFGVAPNICLVPVTEQVTSDRIGVRPDKRMRPGHIMVGLDRDDTEAKTWKPVMRSSDEVGVVLLGPNGEEINRLRPVKAKRSAPPAKPAAPVATPAPKAKRSAATPTSVAEPVVAPTIPLRPRPKADPAATRSETKARQPKGGPIQPPVAKSPARGKQLPLSLDQAPVKTLPAKPRRGDSGAVSLPPRPTSATTTGPVTPAKKASAKVVASVANSEAKNNAVTKSGKSAATGKPAAGTMGKTPTNAPGGGAGRTKASA